MSRVKDLLDLNKSLEKEPLVPKQNVVKKEVAVGIAPREALLIPDNKSASSSSESSESEPQPVEDEVPKIRKYKVDAGELENKIM